MEPILENEEAAGELLLCPACCVAVAGLELILDTECITAAETQLLLMAMEDAGAEVITLPLDDGGVAA